VNAVGRVLLLLGAAGTAICAVLPWVTLKGLTFAIDLGVIGASVTPVAQTVSGTETPIWPILVAVAVVVIVVGLLGIARRLLAAIGVLVVVAGSTRRPRAHELGRPRPSAADRQRGRDLCRRLGAEAMRHTAPDRRLSRTRALVGARILMLVGLLSAGLTAATPAAPARTVPVCRAATILDRLVDRGKLTRQEIELGRGVTSVRCRDLTGDGERDALFAVASGGSAGNTNFGVLLGRAGGTPGRLALYRNGYKVAVATTAGQPEVLQPIYRRDDPNCCPSSFEIRRYRWTGERFTLRSRHRTKSAPKRFRA